MIEKDGDHGSVDKFAMIEFWFAIEYLDVSAIELATIMPKC